MPTRARLFVCGNGQSSLKETVNVILFVIT